MSIAIRGLCPLIQVFDMPATLRFYRDILGFSEAGKSPPGRGDDVGWAWLRHGDACLMLNTAYDVGERPGTPDPRRVAGHGDTILFLECEDLDGAHAHFAANGVRADPPKVAPYGMKQLHLADPMVTACASNGRRNRRSRTGAEGAPGAAEQEAAPEERRAY